MGRKQSVESLSHSRFRAGVYSRLRVRWWIWALKLPAKEFDVLLRVDWKRFLNLRRNAFEIFSVILELIRQSLLRQWFARDAKVLVHVGDSDRCAERVVTSIVLRD